MSFFERIFFAIICLIFCFIYKVSAENCIGQSSSIRNNTWRKIWLQKGEKGKFSNEDLHSIDGFPIEKEYWEKLINNLIDLCHLNDCKNICDFGCGSGAFLKQILKKYPSMNVYGCDYAESLVSIAQKNIQEGKFWVHDITLPLSDKMCSLKPFDAIVCYGVLIYLNSFDDVEKAILNMMQLLKPGGKLILGEINDLEKKDLSKKIRAKTSSSSQYLCPELDVDHLYLSRDFFINLAKKLNAQIDFIEFSDIDPDGLYSNGLYRFHVVMRLPY